MDTLPFREVTLIDFEFAAPPGARPTPVCLVVRELRSGRRARYWQDELQAMGSPPYATDAESVVVAYYSSAEFGCHLALGWPLPENALDLFVEFRRMTNGLPLPAGRALLGALAYFGLDAMDGVEKDAMRELAQRPGGWSDEEKHALLDYCEQDVAALERLLPHIEQALPGRELHRALVRARYMMAAARMEHAGVPIDQDALTLLRDNWEHIKSELIARIDTPYGVYDGASFRRERWEHWLARHGIPWPKLDSGHLALDDDTFREMARVYPAVMPMRELRYSLSQLRLADLAVGPDGRNRTLLSAFAAKTGRNQPSNSRFIFGPAVWLRGLIRPEPGHGLAYVDYEQQEFGVAAALARDERMMEAYLSGDPYLAFAKQAGAAPPEATPETHAEVRERFKACSLAVQYAMGPASLARRLGMIELEALTLLATHRRTFPDYWRWSDAAVDVAMLGRPLETVLGWPVRVGDEPNPRSLRNFPVQANGAEVLRLACTLLTEKGMEICAPVHDAVLVHAPAAVLDAVVGETQAIMAQASSTILGGFTLRSEAKLVRHPDRYRDKRGADMWDTVMSLLRPR